MNVRIAACCCILLPTTAVVSQESIDFNREVRPILSDRCFACHGPDEETRQADLRLDDRDSATRDVGEYRVIVEGKAAESELIRRVTSTDNDEIMPPVDYGKPLTAEEIDTLKQWIDQGAGYQQHWSLTPLKRPEVPVVSGEPPPNAIDAFIHARLESEGVNPSPSADPRTLVRRLSFDLTGLPPQPEVVDEFVEHPTAEAYRVLVEELLKSPHYGERMAIHWLDLVRYADTLGFHGDQPRSVSPYRDYVINAFNSNKPFDEFTIEQLAGDLLPDASLWQKVASTYNRLNRASGEGGVQPKEYLAKYSADRVRTTGAVWLGSTFGCAECHDHKFDPFTSRDFYSFAAFFADIKEQGIVRSAVHIEQLPVPTAQQAARLEELSTQIAAAEMQFNAATPELATARERWEQEIAADSKRWSVLKPESAESHGGATLKVLDDNSVLASGSNPDTDVYQIRGSGIDVSEPDGSIALRLELLPDKSLPRSGPGRAGNGNLVLHAVEMTVNGQPVTWESAVASHSQINHAPEYVIDGHKHGWAILPQAGQPLQLVLVGQVSNVSIKNRSAGEDKKTSSAADRQPSVVNEATSHRENGLVASSTTVEVRLRQNHGAGHNIGRFRLSVSTDANAGQSTVTASEEAQSIVAIPTMERTDEQKISLDAAFRNSTPLLKEVRDQLNSLREARDRLEKSVVTTLATTATAPRPIRVLPRGNWMDDSGALVEPAVPHFLPQLETPDSARLTRLDLARWLTSKDNPLVARTFVNRLWMLMFGQGLARSVDDLGSQGEPPTHPELLDWLAVEFIESGWDVKHIVTQIVTSDTYRQSSHVSQELAQTDPYNRLYARQSRWRLEAEMIRDNALLVSGLLNQEVGGVSTKPYQPPGYWAQLNFPRRTYQHDKGSNQYRRGIYTHWQRTFLHPSLLAFDAPPREECTARRSRSNTPLQSLVLLNDPTFVEAARVLAQRVITTESSAFSDRLAWLTRETLMRDPRAEETVLLQALFENEHRAYQDFPDQADQLISIGEAPVSEQIDRAELAAWTSVTRAIFNLHESITRY